MVQIYNLFLIIVIIKKLSESWWAFEVCDLLCFLLEPAKDVSVIISRAQSPHWMVFPLAGSSIFKVILLWKITVKLQVFWQQL